MTEPWVLKKAKIGKLDILFKRLQNVRKELEDLESDGRYYNSFANCQNVGCECWKGRSDSKQDAYDTYEELCLYYRQAEAEESKIIDQIFSHVWLEELYAEEECH